MTALSFRLYAITDRRCGSPEPLLARTEPGTVAVQLRDKDLPLPERRVLAEATRDLCRRFAAPLFIGGGDVELARRVGADGVHLPSRYVPAARDDLLVACSCHDLAELDRAGSAGVDLVTLSPVLASPDKGAPMGWPRFSEFAHRTAVPVFALGGLSPEDLDRACAHGAFGVAGIRAFLGG